VGRAKVAVPYRLVRSEAVLSGAADFDTLSESPVVKRIKIERKQNIETDIL